MRYIPNDIILGENSWASHHEIEMEEAARRRHLYIIGQTGTGKSTLLLNLIEQDIRYGAGLCLLDPHGDLALQVLATVPRHRAKDVIYLDPCDTERPFGFNPIANIPQELRASTAEAIVNAFKHIWADSWGARLDYIFTNAVRALLDVRGGTLVMLPKFLTHQTFREEIVRKYVEDPLVKNYWLNEYASYPDHFRAEAIAPLQNKIGKVLMSPLLRNMFAQTSSTFTPSRIMDEGSIFICNLSKGNMGESSSHLLGALLLSSFASAAFARGKKQEQDRRLFHLYCDEFQNFASDSFSLILSEARKFGLTLTLSHQYLDELSPTLQSAIFGNVGSIVSLRIGVKDAELLAQYMGLGNKNQILDLYNFQGFANIIVNNSPSSGLALTLYPPSRKTHHTIEPLITNSRFNYGRPRESVETKVKRFLST
jgi:hypothetical protein